VKKKVIVTAITIVAVVAVGIKGRTLLKERQNAVANEPTPKARQISVALVSPSQGELVKKEHFLATVASDKTINLSTKLAGYIKKIYVQESQKVKKGDLLVTIDENELLSSIEALLSTMAMQEADLKLAISTFERNKKLYEAGGLSQEMLERSSVAVDAKAAQLEGTKQKIAQLQHQRSYLKIRAPFDATVDVILLHQGDLAVVSKPIIRLNNQEQKLRFLYAQNKNNIQAGMEVLYNNKVVGNIRTIYPTATNGLATAEVKLLQPLPLPIGSNIDIDVVTAKQNGCILPTKTLVHKEKQTFVMQYKDGKFIPAKVEVVSQNQDKVIVLPCPTTPVAQASETKLAQLPAYGKVLILGAKNE
jgi:RND family efflux transporter MFP subunit